MEVTWQLSGIYYFLMRNFKCTYGYLTKAAAFPCTAATRSFAHVELLKILKCRKSPMTSKSTCSALLWTKPH